MDKLDSILAQHCATLEWHGGTFEQIVKEIKRLKRADDACKNMSYVLKHSGPLTEHEWKNACALIHASQVRL